MGVAEHVDRNAAGEIEIAIAVGGGNPNAFASLEGEVDTGVGRQQMRGHGAFANYPWRMIRSENR